MRHSATTHQSGKYWSVIGCTFNLEAIGHKMKIAQNIKIMYFLYLLGVFFLPLLIIPFVCVKKLRKEASEWWLLNHCEVLVKYIYYSATWIVATILIVYLLSLIGSGFFIFGFIIGAISLIILWGYAAHQYFILTEAEDKKQVLEEVGYFLGMKIFYQQKGSYLLALILNAFDKIKSKIIKNKS